MTYEPKPLWWIVGSTFRDSLWTESPVPGRSPALTALYALRHRGAVASRRPTYHDHWEMLTVRAGAGRLAGATPMPLREHMICLVPPMTAHQEESEGNLDVIWVGFCGTHLAGLDASHVHSVASRDVSDLIERMWLFAQTTPGAIGPELDAMAALIVARFLRLRTGETLPTTDRVERAILMFHDKMAESVSIADVARKLGCSPSCLTREFRRRTGQTPIAYLTGIRIRHAARLLETTDLKLREIAALTGYSDEFYFSRTFARATGRSPSAWRLASVSPPR
jgi:AraC family transcriptional regulator of arabinose operon